MGKYIVSEPKKDDSKGIIAENPKPVEIAPVLEEEVQEVPEPVIEDNEPVMDLSEELQKYKDLLEKGLITEADYDAKKKQILGI